MYWICAVLLLSWLGPGVELASSQGLAPARGPVRASAPMPAPGPVPAATPMPAPAPQMVLPVGIGVATTFTWVYPEAVPGLSGFRFMRCGPTLDDCVPTTEGGTMMAPSERRATDPTGQAGQRYCWALVAVLTSGARSTPSASACHTLPGVMVGIPLPTPEGSGP